MPQIDSHKHKLRRYLVHGNLVLGHHGHLVGLVVLLSVCSVLVWGLTVRAALCAIYVVLLGYAAMRDYQSRIIPNQICLAIALLGVVCAVLSSIRALNVLNVGFPAPTISCLERAAASCLMGFPLVLANLFGADFGGGDIKLLAASGLVVGLHIGLTGMIIGLTLAGLQALTLKLKGAQGTDTFALGPMLAIGCTAAVMLCGTQPLWCTLFLVS